MNKENLSLAFLFSFLLTFSLSVVKADNIDPGTTNNKTLNGFHSFELGEAILLFMPDKNTDKETVSVEWDYRVDTVPMVWLTEGYTETGNYGKGIEAAFRKGLMRINVDGVKSFILRKTKEELAWRVSYSTENMPKFDVESIELSIDGGIGDKDADVCFGHLYYNCSFNPEKSMSKAGIDFKKICEKYIVNTEYIGYELTHKDKRKILARLITSGGTGGVISSFELNFSKKAKELCDDTSEKVEEPPKTENKKETISTKSQKSENHKTSKEICNAVSTLAKSIMSARQNGVSMSKAMELSSDNKLTESFVIEAYSKSGFSTEKYQDKTIREFADEAYLSCIKSLPRD